MSYYAAHKFFDYPCLLKILCCHLMNVYHIKAFLVYESIKKFISFSENLDPENLSVLFPNSVWITAYKLQNIMDWIIICNLRITTIFKFNPNYIYFTNNFHLTFTNDYCILQTTLIDEEIPNYYLNRSGHYIKHKILKVFYFSFTRIFVLKK